MTTTGEKMRIDTRTDAQRYYDALKAIARKYQTTDQLRRNAGQYGLSYKEELEMAYENLQAAADDAIFGKKRPRP